ncbi:MAG: hypothetical protein ACOC16_00675 [Nanoarchaeota archaeon]
MKFIDVCQILEKLEKNSQRLKKILILRDFLITNKRESKIIFDMIAGNYQRKIDKKTLGISIKTIFSSVTLISRVSQLEIEKRFNKTGDIGEVIAQILEKNKQNYLFTKDLMIEDIEKSFQSISKNIGSNSNKKKKEIISNLFLLAKSKLEYKFITRLLIDDLRVGVSEGSLKESVVNSYFPNIVGIHLMCENCNYINLNLKKCFNCNKDIDLKRQEEIISKKYNIVELETPNYQTSLLDYDIKYFVNQLEYAIRRDREKYFIKTQNPRELYNKFLELFEKKYNLINSFEKILTQLDENLNNVLNFEIKLGLPIKSMLGSRSDSIEDSFKTTLKPSIVDFKYDGLRTQIHNKKGEVNIFTRNLEDITKQFPEIIDFIKNNFSDIEFVIDAECVGYDFKNNTFLPFQTLSKRILTKNLSDVSHINVVVKCFDLLYLNGKTLIDENYKNRREILEELFLNRTIIENNNFNVEELER